MLFDYIRSHRQGRVFALLFRQPALSLEIVHACLTLKWLLWLMFIAVLIGLKKLPYSVLIIFVSIKRNNNWDGVIWQKPRKSGNCLQLPPFPKPKSFLCISWTYWQCPLSLHPLIKCKDNAFTAELLRKSWGLGLFFLLLSLWPHFLLPFLPPRTPINEWALHAR